MSDHSMRDSEEGLKRRSIPGISCANEVVFNEPAREHRFQTIACEKGAIPDIPIDPSAHERKYPPLKTCSQVIIGVHNSKEKAQMALYISKMRQSAKKS
jgi:hypothetical protein